MTKEIIVSSDTFGEGWTKQNRNNTELFNNTGDLNYLSNYDTWELALADIGTTEITLTVDVPMVLTGNITTPSTLSLHWLSGAVTNGAYTFDINGNLAAGRYQLFGDTVTVTGNIQAEYIVPQWFGAVGDGVTDDTDAIHAAIDLALSTGNGVRLGPERYYITHSINIPQTTASEGFTLEGCGKGQTIITCSTSLAGYALKITGNGSVANAQRRGVLKDFAIDGQKGTSAAGGIKFDFAYVWQLYNIYIYDFFKSGAQPSVMAKGIYLKDVFNIYGVGCHVNLGDSGVTSYDNTYWHGSAGACCGRPGKA